MVVLPVLEVWYPVSGLWANSTLAANTVPVIRHGGKDRLDRGDLQ